MIDPTDLVPVRQIAAHELVVDRLRRSLNQGQFRPGDHLPTERDLAEMLQVSRTTVRSAVAVLEGEGRVSVRRGRGGGFTVLDPPHDATQARREFHENTMLIRDTFDVRVIVESGAVALAAHRRTAVDILHLRDLVARMDQAIVNEGSSEGASIVTEFLMLDTEFHLALARCSGNQALCDEIATNRNTMWTSVGPVFHRIDENANDHHAEILAAVEARDSEQSARLMTEHINMTRRTLESWLRS